MTTVGNKIAEQRTFVVGWFAVVVLSRLYTVVLCDIGEKLFGFEWLCHTWVHDIAVYLWFELIVFGPVMWFALYQINTDVFSGQPSDGTANNPHRRVHFAATAAAAAYFYGVGVHVADTIEVLSREREGITDGPVYDLVLFIDEDVSHYIQFVSLFFLIGWYVIHDRPGRTTYPDLALFLGVAHGIERGLGTIEGGKWFMGPAVVAWMLVAVWVRQRRVGSAASQEFFVRFAIAFTIVFPLTLGAYYLWSGDFTAPSAIGDGEYLQLAIGSVGLAGALTAVAVALDRRLRRGAAPVAGSKS